MKLDKQYPKLGVTYFVGLLVYLSGILGILSPYRDWFVSMTPWSLLLTLGLLLRHQRDFSKDFWFFSFFAFVSGFGFEVLGVNTGFPFGDYSYGMVLGPKLLGTPIIIGVNWLLITWTSNAVLQRFFKDKPFWLLLMLGALLPTMIDVIIEPVAIQLGFWAWTDGWPPLQNYLGWFGVSLLIALAYRRRMRDDDNPATLFVLLLQVSFFAILWLSQLQVIY
jgi:uncharacterized membrane protein